MSRLVRALTSSDMYQRLRASLLYDIYWRLANPAIIRARDADVLLYRQVLEGLHPSALIFDVGANHGAKVDVFLRLGARVVAFEPDLRNQQILRAKFLKYRLSALPVRIDGRAVAESDSTRTMWIEQPGSAKNTLNPKWVDVLSSNANRFGYRPTFEASAVVETATVDRLIDTYGHPFFVKIDVEGLELSVLRGLSRAVPFLSFEVNLPEFLEEGLECIQRLEAIHAGGRFNLTLDGRPELALSSWVAMDELRQALLKTRSASVEVFWRSGLDSVRGQVPDRP